MRTKSMCTMCSSMSSALPARSLYRECKVGGTEMAVPWSVPVIILYISVPANSHLF